MHTLLEICTGETAAVYWRRVGWWPITLLNGYAILCNHYTEKCGIYTSHFTAKPFLASIFNLLLSLEKRSTSGWLTGWGSCFGFGCWFCFNWWKSLSVLEVFCYSSTSITCSKFTTLSFERYWNFPCIFFIAASNQVSFNDLQPGQTTDDWNTLAPVNLTTKGDFGSIRVKAKFLHEVIMPLKEYTSLKGVC